MSTLSASAAHPVSSFLQEAAGRFCDFDFSIIATPKANLEGDEKGLPEFYVSGKRVVPFTLYDVLASLVVLVVRRLDRDSMDLRVLCG